MAELQPGLPQLEVIELVARGGMGAVYKGVQKSLNRHVAIKVLPPDMARDPSFAERFKEEALSMAKLSHPGIVSVYDAGKTKDGLLYFMMEYVEGTDVAQLIQQEHRIEPKQALEITVAVCEALAYAHESGVIHRDIKPSNIMLDRHRRVKITDFGLAKQTEEARDERRTRSRMAIGTPDFVAPEALNAGTVPDHRVDLYSVGGHSLPDADRPDSSRKLCLAFRGCSIGGQPGGCDRGPRHEKRPRPALFHRRSASDGGSGCAGRLSLTSFSDTHLAQALAGVGHRCGRSRRGSGSDSMGGKDHRSSASTAPSTFGLR